MFQINTKYLGELLFTRCLRSKKNCNIFIAANKNKTSLTRNQKIVKKKKKKMQITGRDDRRNGKRRL